MKYKEKAYEFLLKDSNGDLRKDAHEYLLGLHTDSALVTISKTKNFLEQDLSNSFTDSFSGKVDADFYDKLAEGIVTQSNDIPFQDQFKIGVNLVSVTATKVTNKILSTLDSDYTYFKMVVALGRSPEGAIISGDVEPETMRTAANSSGTRVSVEIQDKDDTKQIVKTCNPLGITLSLSAPVFDDVLATELLKIDACFNQLAGRELEYVLIQALEEEEIDKIELYKIELMIVRRGEFLKRVKVQLKSRLFDMDDDVIHEFANNMLNGIYSSLGVSSLTEWKLDVGLDYGSVEKVLNTVLTKNMISSNSTRMKKGTSSTMLITPYRTLRRTIPIHEDRIDLIKPEVIALEVRTAQLMENYSRGLIDVDPLSVEGLPIIKDFDGSAEYRSKKIYNVLGLSDDEAKLTKRELNREINDKIEDRIEEYVNQFITAQMKGTNI